MSLKRSDLKKLVSEVFDNNSMNLWEYSLESLEELELEEVDSQGEKESVEETSAAGGGGAIEGGMGSAWKDDSFKLKESVRSVLFEVIRENVSNYLVNENKLRGVIKDILLEKKSAVTMNPHQLTGINALEVTLRNIMPTIEADYKTLTTSQEQRDGFEAQIQHSLKNLVQRVIINKKSDEDPSLDGEFSVGDIEEPPEEMLEGANEEAEEEGGMKLNIIDEDNPFIDISVDGDKAEKVKQPEEPKDERELEPVEGIDPTGRSKALKSVQKVSKQIETDLSELSNPVDIKAYSKYLAINLDLYIDKWNDEMSAQLDKIEAKPEPDDKVDTGDGLGSGELESEPEEEDMIPADLQEEWKEALKTKLEFYDGA